MKKIFLIIFGVFQCLGIKVAFSNIDSIQQKANVQKCIKNTKKIITNKLKENGYVHSIKYSIQKGSKLSVKVSEHSINIILPELYSRWCLKRDQKYLARHALIKLEKEVNSVLSESVLKFISGVSPTDALEMAQCKLEDVLMSLSADSFKLNEKTGVVTNHRGKPVKDISTLSFLAKEFFEKRAKSDFSFIIQGTKHEDVVDQFDSCEMSGEVCSCESLEFSMVPKYVLNDSKGTLDLNFNSGVAYRSTVIESFTDTPYRCGVQTEEQLEEVADNSSAAEINSSEEDQSHNSDGLADDGDDKKSKLISSSSEGPRVYVIKRRPKGKIPVIILKDRAVTENKTNAEPPVEKPKDDFEPWLKLFDDEIMSVSQLTPFDHHTEDSEEIDLEHLVDENGNIHSKDGIRLANGTSLKFPETHHTCFSLEGNLSPFTAKFTESFVSELYSSDIVNYSAFRKGNLVCLIK